MIISLYHSVLNVHHFILQLPAYTSVSLPISGAGMGLGLGLVHLGTAARSTELSIEEVTECGTSSLLSPPPQR